MIRVTPLYSKYLTWNWTLHSILQNKKHTYYLHKCMPLSLLTPLNVRGIRSVPKDNSKIFSQFSWLYNSSRSLDPNIETLSLGGIARYNNNNNNSGYLYSAQVHLSVLMTKTCVIHCNGLKWINTVLHVSSNKNKVINELGN